MNPESILHADVIDIVFENRNKDYGAYELRTRYNKRLRNAMTMMFSFMIIFCSLLYVDNHFFHHHLNKIISFEIADVNISQAHEDKQVAIKSKPIQPARQQVATTKDFIPKIVPAHTRTDPTPTVEELQKEIGSVTKPGELAGNIAPVVSSGNEKGNSTETKTETDEPVIFKTAEIMPEFPGGMEALQRFLAKNMRMPKDLEPGTRIKVLEKFVVDANGDISAMQTVQTGGAEFDNEVTRVLKKMPRWKPGKQNGKNVAVYFTLPVIFQSQDDN